MSEQGGSRNEERLGNETQVADAVLRKPLSSAGLERSLARWLGQLPEVSDVVPAAADSAALSLEEMLERAVREAALGR